jgi:predicted DsbA family dithiol-disulfide isomerase
LQDEYDVEVDWRGFELHPDTPVGGRALADYLGAARLPAMKEHLKRFADAFGVAAMKVPEHMPNTRRALALAEWARAEGRLAPFREAVMRAHWESKANIEDEAVLAGCAEAAGLDAARARAALADAAWMARVDALGAEAAREGVTGIPTFVFDGARVVGCQPYEEIAAAADAAGARRRER